MDASGTQAELAVVDVAVLFADPKGVYAGLPGVDLWDEARDARHYDGPHPVVAHPPCARWSRLAGFTEARFGYKRGEDGGCFVAALTAVRMYGGVLEHPAYSSAWATFDLPRPQWRGGWTHDLFDKGASCYVEQGRYGLPVKKATYLYAHGVELPELRWGFTPDSAGERPNGPWGGIDGWRDAHRGRFEQFTKGTHRGGHKGLTAITPPAFRDVLIDMARTSTTRPEAAPESVPLPVSASSVEARTEQDPGDAQSASSGGAS